MLHAATKVMCYGVAEHSIILCIIPVINIGDKS